MDKPSVIYTPRPDATSENELHALACVYRFVLERHAARAAAAGSFQLSFTLPEETEDLLFSLGEFWEGALGRAPVLGALAAAFGIWYALGALGVVAYPF